MRMKKGLIVQQIENDYFLIDSGEEMPKFSGMIKLNETALTIVNLLMENDLSLDEIYQSMLKQYNTSLDELKEAIPPLINKLIKINLIIK